MRGARARQTYKQVRSCGINGAPMLERTVRTDLRLQRMVATGDRRMLVRERTNTHMHVVMVVVAWPGE